MIRHESPKALNPSSRFLTLGRGCKYRAIDKSPTRRRIEYLLSCPYQQRLWGMRGSRAGRHVVPWSYWCFSGREIIAQCADLVRVKVMAVARGIAIKVSAATAVVAMILLVFCKSLCMILCCETVATLNLRLSTFLIGCHTTRRPISVVARWA